MRIITFVTVVALGAMLVMTAAETTTKASTQAAKTSSKTGAKSAAPKQATPKPITKAAAQKPAVAKSFVSTKSSAPKNGAAVRTSKPVSKPAPTRFQRSAQQQPTPDRYREIQQALADKGYFSGPVDGVWGADSVEALKRFQRDQNLTDDGKIGSLSLIALGLGPSREAVLTAPATSTP